MIDHAQIKELEYHYIADGIFIGTNHCCQTHFNEKLKKEGISVDISLEKERIDTPLGVEFYVWIPVKNHTAPTQEQLDFGVSVLEKLVSLRKKIYVHCKNGHGRAPTLVAAYLIRKGKNADEAEALIKSRRPSIHLDDMQRETLSAFAKATADEQEFVKSSQK